MRQWCSVEKCFNSTNFLPIIQSLLSIVHLCQMFSTFHQAVNPSVPCTSHFHYITLLLPLAKHSSTLLSIELNIVSQSLSSWLKRENFRVGFIRITSRTHFLQIFMWYSFPHLWLPPLCLTYFSSSLLIISNVLSVVSGYKRVLTTPGVLKMIINSLWYEVSQHFPNIKFQIVMHQQQLYNKNPSTIKSENYSNYQASVVQGSELTKTKIKFHWNLFYWFLFCNVLLR